MEGHSTHTKDQYCIAVYYPQARQARVVSGLSGIENLNSADLLTQTKSERVPRTQTHITRTGGAPAWCALADDKTRPGQ
jgi:hypothetical protein